MKQIKIFQGNDVRKLEQEINEWLVSSDIKEPMIQVTSTPMELPKDDESLIFISYCFIITFNNSDVKKPRTYADAQYT